MDRLSYLIKLSLESNSQSRVLEWKTLVKLAQLDFSTDNVIIKRIGQSLLQVYAPRLVQGDGSIIKMEVFLNNTSAIP